MIDHSTLPAGGRAVSCSTGGLVFPAGKSRGPSSFMGSWAPAISGLASASTFTSDLKPWFQTENKSIIYLLLRKKLGKHFRQHRPVQSLLQTEKAYYLAIVQYIYHI